MRPGLADPANHRASELAARVARVPPDDEFDGRAPPAHEPPGMTKGVELHELFGDEAALPERLLRREPPALRLRGEPHFPADAVGALDALGSGPLPLLFIGHEWLGMRE